MLFVVNTGYVASSHLKQSDIKRVLKMLLSEPLASLITFSGRVKYIQDMMRVVIRYKLILNKS